MATIYADVAALNSGSSVEFVNSGSISTLNVTDANSNTIIGKSSGKSGISGTQNTALGALSLKAATSAGANVSVGYNALGLLTTGTNNTAVGDGAGNSIITGRWNTLLGYEPGSAYTSSESSNIIISNSGVPTENNVVRIGSQGTGSGQQNLCFIAGITAATPTSGNTPQVVLCDNTGNLTTISSSSSGYLLTSNGSSTPSFQAPASSSITFTGDTGTPFSGSGVTVTGGTSGLSVAASTPDLTIGGVLKLANGGTNANLTASNGGIFYSTASAGAILAGTATANQMLQSGASTTPAWSTSTWPATTTINQLLYSSSANVVAGLATGNNGVLITSASGVPSILADGTTGQVLTATTGSPPSWSTLTTGVSSVTGTANQILASPTTGAVVLSLIGPYTPSTYTAHSVLIGEGTSSIVGVGPTATAGQILQSAGSTSDPAFSTATYPSTTTISQILYSSSANVVSGLATANNGTLITGTTGIPSWLANGTTGQVLTATTGSPPSWVSPATSGTVTSVSVVSANGFAGTVATATTTPAITLTTTQTGLLSGNGTAVTGTGITQYNVITGGGSNAPNSVAPSATSGLPLISQGSSAQPVFGTAVVAGGGTGDTSFTAYAPLCGGTTTTGNLQSASTGISNSGYILTSTGASSLPTWQAQSGGTLSINMQVFTSSGTYTPTSGMVYCIVEMTGGGGGSGSSAATSATALSAGGGGGGGEYARGVFSATTIGSSQTVTIGSGGSAASTGGTTSLGSLMTALGGGGGTNSAANSYIFSLGGAGGTGGTGGSYRCPGQPGGYGFGINAGTSATRICFGGYGGGNLLVSNAQVTPAAAFAVNGISGGQGATGSSQTVSEAGQPGGTGGAGLILITEYI